MNKTQRKEDNLNYQAAVAALTDIAQEFENNKISGIQQFGEKSSQILEDNFGGAF